MTTDRIMDDIIDDCLGRLLLGETIEECVNLYPDHELHLRTLLEAAEPTINAISSVSFRSTAKTRGLQKLMDKVSGVGQTPARSTWMSWNSVFAKPILTGLATVLIITGMAFGTTTVSSNSVPGEPLFFVKSASESISLMIPQPDVARARKHIKLAAVRGKEMRILMSRNEFQATEQVADRIRHHLNAGAGYMGLMTSTNTVEMPHRPAVLIKNDATLHEVRNQLMQDLGSLQSYFAASIRTVPTHERQRANLIRLRSEMIYRTMVSAIEGADSPSWGPFWREEPPRRRRPVSDNRFR